MESVSRRNPLLPKAMIEALLSIGRVFAVVVLLGCDQGVDQQLIKEFPHIRSDLIELRTLMLKLANESDIEGLSVGKVARYNETESYDSFWIKGREGLFLAKEVTPRLSPPQQAEIARLGQLAKKVDCDYVGVREAESVWVAMKAGGTFAEDLGYLHKGKFDVQGASRGKYLPIPGEQGWYVFVR